MSKLVHVRILVTDVLIKAFDVTFLMVRQLVGVGILWYESGSFGPDKQWKVERSLSKTLIKILELNLAPVCLESIAFLSTGASSTPPLISR